MSRLLELQAKYSQDKLKRKWFELKVDTSLHEKLLRLCGTTNSFFFPFEYEGKKNNGASKSTKNIQYNWRISLGGWLEMLLVRIVHKYEYTQEKGREASGFCF